MKKIIIIGVILLSIVALVSILWNNKASKVELVNPAFTGYISGFTSGIISSDSEIIIHLREELSEAKRMDVTPTDLFDFEPEIDGEAYWKDSKTIVFKPEEKLISGQLYTAEFRLSKLIDVPSDLKRLDFNFQTIKQAIDVKFDGIEAYDDVDLQWQKMKGTLRTADAATSSSVEALFSAKQNNKNLKIKWTHHNEKEHQFVVDSIVRVENKETVFLNWEGTKIGADENGELKIEVPSLNDFKIVNVRVFQQPNQYVSVNFSDPIKNNQDLEGLIFFESAKKYD
jgi:hypothetical protein